MCCGNKKNEVDSEINNKGILVKSESRKCTNVYCILIFGVAWSVFIAFLVVGLASGEKDRLWYGTDYEGRLCGGSEMKDKKYIYYPRLQTDIMTHLATINPGSQSLSFSDLTELVNVPLYGICMSECPKKKKVVCNDEFKIGSEPSDNDMLVCYTGTGSTDSKCKNCWYVPIDTSSMFYRCMYKTVETPLLDQKCEYPPTSISVSDPKCISKLVTTGTTSTVIATGSPVIEQLLYWKARISGWMADLVTVFPWILLIGVVGSIIFGYIYVLFVKLSIRCFVYILLLLSISIAVCFTTFCFYQAQYFSSSILDDIFSQITEKAEGVFEILPDSSNKTYWEVGSWIMVVIDIILFAIIIFTWGSIKKIVSTIETASNVMFKYPSMLLMPIFFILQYVIFAAFFIYSSAMLFTLKEDPKKIISSSLKNGNICPVPNIACNDFADFLEVKDSNYGVIMIWINLFGFFWTTQFLDALYIMIIGGTVGEYYFTPKNNTKDKYIEDGSSSGSPLCNSFKRAYRFHLGTAIFGSLLIAIVKIIRAILAYIQKQLKGSENKIVKCLLCCLSCCFWCLEKCLKFMTKNAYIYTAIKGYGFIQACKQTITDVMGNISLFALNGVVISTIQFIGKMVICLICGFGSYWLFSSSSIYKIGGSNELSNAFIPVLVVILISYIVASMVMSIYGLVADSLIICLLEDERNFYNLKLESPYTPDTMKSVFT